jgi:hypothetical protein
MRPLPGLLACLATFYIYGCIKMSSYQLLSVLRRLRVPGVLQRFGICYWVVASAGFLLARHRPEDRQISWSTDLRDLLPHWIIMLAILAVHQVLTVRNSYIFLLVIKFFKELF